MNEPETMTAADVSPDATATAAPATRSALEIKSESAFLADEMQAARAGTWSFLARVLSASPDRALLDTLAGLGGIDTSAGRIAMGWELLRRAATAPETTVDALEDEYLALFIGLGRGELVPFGSWYLTGFLMEKPLALLRRDLDRLGIEREAGVTESEDHAGALADAMAILIRAGDEVPLAEQRAFFEAHVAPWMARFFVDMQAAEGARFYRSVGFFGEAVLDFESTLLGMPG